MRYVLLLFMLMSFCAKAQEQTPQQKIGDSYRLMAVGFSGLLLSAGLEASGETSENTVRAIRIGSYVMLLGGAVTAVIFTDQSKQLSLKYDKGISLCYKF